MKRSFVQVYTGNGKGKTTAAMGLAMRAAGRGMVVKIVQFLKGRDTGEMFVIDKIDNMSLVRVSDCRKFFKDLSDDEKLIMRQDVSMILPVINSWLGLADLIILDEAMAAVAVGILGIDELMHIINSRGTTEIVLTGRDVPEQILEAADLVTEMRDVKHYMDAGVSARKGIEY